MPGLPLAALSLPPELAVPIAIFGGIGLGLALLVFLVSWLGRRVSVALGGLIALYATTTFVLAHQSVARKAEMAAREAARKAAALRRIEALAAATLTTPLADACAAAPTLALRDIGLLFKGYDVRSVVYRVIDGDLVGDDEHVTTWAPSTLHTWYEMATSPGEWQERLADAEDYRLARMQFALVVVDRRAALVDLAADRELCRGVLPESFRGERSGHGSMSPTFARPLVPLCAHLEGDDGVLCPTIERTAARW